MDNSSIYLAMTYHLLAISWVTFRIDRAFLDDPVKGRLVRSLDRSPFEPEYRLFAKIETYVHFD
jgi:hypothetical protein